MLTPEEKAAIFEQETYRDEVRREISERGKKSREPRLSLSEQLDRPFTLWLLSTVLVSAIAFGYESVEGALADGFLPDLISSDVHVISVEGPGYDLLHTMSKLLNCGVSLADVIGMSTSRPALAIRRPDLGHLGVGAVADISVLREMKTDYTFSDVTGVTRQGSTILQPLACYIGGKEMEVSTRPFEAPYLYENPHHRHDHRH